MSFGGRSQPWTLAPSLNQWRLFASPQKRGTSWFDCVSGFQAPIEPAWTSGGAPKDWTIAGEAVPVGAPERLDRADGPVQSVAVFPVAGFRVAMPVWPSTYSAYRISPADR